MSSKGKPSLKEIKGWVQREAPGLFEFNAQRRALRRCISLYPCAFEGISKTPISHKRLVALYEAQELLDKVPGYKKIWNKVKNWERNLHEVDGILEQIYFALNLYKAFSRTAGIKISLSSKRCGDIYLSGFACIELKSIETMPRKDQLRLKEGHSFRFTPKIKNNPTLQEKIAEAVMETSGVKDDEIRLLFLKNPYLPKRYPELSDLDALVVYYYQNAKRLDDLFTSELKAKCGVYCNSKKLETRIRRITKLLWKGHVSISTSNPPHTLKSAPGGRRKRQEKGVRGK